MTDIDIAYMGLDSISPYNNENLPNSDVLINLFDILFPMKLGYNHFPTFFPYCNPNLTENFGSENRGTRYFFMLSGKEK